MDRRAIGVFDSGLGGLTAAKVLEETMPCENIIYLGDTANMPYGPRSREDITRLAMQNAEFLQKRNVKAILVACGTVSSNALDKLRESFAVPFFGVIDSAALAACEATETGRIGVIATEASIRSGAYRRAIEACGKSVKVFETACPSFVPLVESGHFSAKDAKVRAAVEAELSALKRFGADTVILGCTHFPILGRPLPNIWGRMCGLYPAAERPHWLCGNISIMRISSSVVMKWESAGGSQAATRPPSARERDFSSATA